MIANNLHGKISVHLLGAIQELLVVQPRLLYSSSSRRDKIVNEVSEGESK